MPAADYRTLIAPEELAPHLGSADWVVIDCRFTLGDPAAGRSAFARSRLPGARYADLEKDLAGEPGPTTGRHPLPHPVRLARRVGDWGITPASQVVVYDDSFGSIAARLWWMLRWVGHRRVALLDGGWPHWKRQQGPLDSEPLAPIARAAAPPYPVAPDAGIIAGRALVEQVRNDPGWRLADARPEERFSGERETIDPLPGHIPGSVNWPFEDNLGFDGRWLAAADLADNFRRMLGGRAGDRVVHTCGSGVTACHNLLAMEHAGLPGSRLYVGSWSEWIRQPDAPRALGPD